MKCPLCKSPLPPDGRCTSMVRNVDHKWQETRDVARAPAEGESNPRFFPQVRCTTCGAETFEDVRRHPVHFPCVPKKVKCTYGQPPLEEGLTHSTAPPPPATS